MSVCVIVEGGPYRGLVPREVRRRALAMLDALGIPASELSVVLTNDESIQALNRDYRGLDRPTDVLAFSQREGPAAGGSAVAVPDLLGDVVVSVPTARRQAPSEGRDVLSEVTWLLAHGLLHLMGWDHDTPTRDRRMRRETERLCAPFGPRSKARARGAGSRVSRRGKPPAMPRKHGRRARA